MNVRRVLGAVVVAFVVIVAAVVGGLWLYTEYLYADSYGSDYHYRVNISPDSRISNVTVLVPLPTEAGATSVTVADLSDSTAPDGWRYDVVDTEFGPALRIQADEIPTDPTYHHSVVENDRLVGWEPLSPDEYDPDNSSHLKVRHDDVDIDVTQQVDETIDTRGALENEPLLWSHENQTDAACFRADDDERCYEYDGRVFLSYDAPEDAQVYVSVELIGANSWWVFGWNYNEYIDRQTVMAVGPEDGWLTTEGELTTGTGSYRDPPR